MCKDISSGGYNSGPKKVRLEKKATKNGFELVSLPVTSAITTIIQLQ